MVEGCNLWWRVVIHGGGLLFVDGGDCLWSSGCVGSSSVWSMVICRGSLSSECRGLYSPLLIPPGIPLESWNSTGLDPEFDILWDCAWNIMGMVFLLLCLVSPYRVPLDSVKFLQNPWTVQRNSMG